MNKGVLPPNYNDAIKNDGELLLYLMGGMQRPLMSVFEILAKLTLSLMVINGH